MAFAQPGPGFRLTDITRAAGRSTSATIPATAADLPETLGPGCAFLTTTTTAGRTSC